MTREYKYELLDILNTEICYQQQKMYVSTAIARFVRNTTDYLDGQTGGQRNDDAL